MRLADCARADSQTAMIFQPLVKSPSSDNNYLTSSVLLPLTVRHVNGRWQKSLATCNAALKQSIARPAIICYRRKLPEQTKMYNNSKAHCLAPTMAHLKWCNMNLYGHIFPLWFIAVKTVLRLNASRNATKPTQIDNVPGDRVSVRKVEMPPSAFLYGNTSWLSISTQHFIASLLRQDVARRINNIAPRWMDRLAHALFGAQLWVCPFVVHVATTVSAHSSSSPADHSGWQFNMSKLALIVIQCCKLLPTHRVCVWVDKRASLTCNRPFFNRFAIHLLNAFARLCWTCFCRQHVCFKGVKSAINPRA